MIRRQGKNLVHVSPIFVPIVPDHDTTNRVEEERAGETNRITSIDLIIVFARPQGLPHPLKAPKSLVML
jgi:hypothetical protein